jgi:uncharacterized protein (DUF433 family)
MPRGQGASWHIEGRVIRNDRELAVARELDWTSCPAVERDPGKLSGVWVFSGTRVPVSALFENLESGATVEQFLDWFPGVARTQVDAVLEHASRGA